VRVGVVGAGSWGTTLANVLAGGGHTVTLWAREPEVVSGINAAHVNPLFLPESELHPALSATGELEAAVSGQELLVVATPSHAVRPVTTEVARVLRGPPPLLVSVTKGLEQDTLHTMAEVLHATLPGREVVVLSGPSFAQEVYRGQPTAVVAASRTPAAASDVQGVFTTGAFRVYTSQDVVGVELGGSLKNVIAIAAGILEGLGMGNNPLAALLTRGLAEMTRLGVALGADARTFAGLAGMGDLILTCTGSLSRNRTLGIELGQGKTLEQALAGKLTVAEGVFTARAAVELGRRTGVELPIAQEVERILFEGKTPARAARDLMEREPKAEHWR